MRWTGQLGKTRIATDWNVRCFKSFAGIGSFKHDGQVNGLFTWHRSIDYRPKGPPDVGRMMFLDQEHGLLQEDGVVQGDDYREICKRLDGDMHNSFGGRCFLPDSPDALGFLVVSGKYAGVAVRFVSTHSEVEGFERSPTPSEQLALDSYFGVIACDGVVVCCSRPIWVGKSVDATVANCIPGCETPSDRTYFHAFITSFNPNPQGYPRSSSSGLCSSSGEGPHNLISALTLIEKRGPIFRCRKPDLVHFLGFEKFRSPKSWALH